MPANDQTWLVGCGVAAQPGGLDFAFGPNVSMSARWADLVQDKPAELDDLPLHLKNLPATLEDGSPACILGLKPAQGPNGPYILGDNVLRSQYVLYDLDR